MTHQQQMKIPRLKTNFFASLKKTEIENIIIITKMAGNLINNWKSESA